MADRDENLYHFTQSSPEEIASYAQEAAAMTRAYRIRGRMIPLVGVLTSLLFCLFVPMWYGRLSGKINEEMALVLVGMLISLLAIPFHLLGGYKAIRVGWLNALFYGLSISVNAMGTSLCMTAYYLHLGHQPDTGAMVAAVLVSAVLYGAVSLLIQVLPDRYSLFTGVGALVTLGLIVTGIVFWVKSDGKALFSFVFFHLVWVLITVIALHVSCSDEESPWMRFSSFASFGILMVVAAVVLLILVCAGGDGCDCDCGGGECCDCGDCGRSENHAARGNRRRR